MQVYVLYVGRGMRQRNIRRVGLQTIGSAIQLRHNPSHRETDCRLSNAMQKRYRRV